MERSNGLLGPRGSHGTEELGGSDAQSRIAMREYLDHAMDTVGSHHGQGVESMESGLDARRSLRKIHN